MTKILLCAAQASHQLVPPEVHFCFFGLDGLYLYYTLFCWCNRFPAFPSCVDHWTYDHDHRQQLCDGQELRGGDDCGVSNCLIQLLIVLLVSVAMSKGKKLNPSRVFNSTSLFLCSLNAIKEVTGRCPLAINEDLLQDLAQYKTHKDKSECLLSPWRRETL